MFHMRVQMLVLLRTLSTSVMMVHLKLMVLGLREVVMRLLVVQTMELVRCT